MRSPRARHQDLIATASPRRGFTLVELLVSLVLVAVGLLALSATTTLVVREVQSAAARLAAGGALRNRVELFMQLPCVVVDGRAAGPRGVTESWHTTLAAGVASLRDSVTLLDRQRRRALVVEVRRPCE